MVAGVDACRFADVHWQSALSINAVTAYEEHIRLFPQCPFASLARIKIDQLSTGQPRAAAAGAGSVESTTTDPDPVRLAALSNAKVCFVYTHDSVGVGG